MSHLENNGSEHQPFSSQIESTMDAGASTVAYAEKQIALRHSERVTVDYNDPNKKLVTGSFYGIRLGEYKNLADRLVKISSNVVALTGRRAEDVPRTDGKELHSEVIFKTLDGNEEPFPTVQLFREQGSNDAKRVEVNGVEWKNLENAKIYSSGVQLQLSPDKKKVAFFDEAGNEGTSIVENDKRWKNKFPSRKESRYIGNELAVFDLGTGLYVNDVPWKIEDSALGEENQKGQRMYRAMDRTVTGKTAVVLDAGYVRKDNQYEKERKTMVYFGDSDGPKGKFELPRSFVDGIAVDEITGLVANMVRKDASSNPELYIQGIKAKTSEDIKSVISFDFTDSIVTLEYLTAIGSVITERISVPQNFQELAKLDKEEKARKEMHALLDQKFFQEGASAADILEKLKNMESVMQMNQTLNERNTALNRKNEELQVQNSQNELKLADLSQVKQENEDYKNSNLKLKSALLNGLKILEGATKKTLGGYDLNKEALMAELKKGE